MSPTGERLVLVVGDTLLAARLCAWMDGEPGFCTAHLAAPSDSKLQATLEQGGVEAVVIAVHEDVSALRHALVVAHTAPDVRTIVTVFDQTMKERLGQLWPHLEIVSPAEIVAPSLAGPCVLPGALAAWTDGGRPYALSDPVRGPEELARPPAVWSDGVAGLRARLRQVALGVHLGQTTGTRMLVAGTGGAGLVLVADWAWLVRLGLPPREAFFDAVRVVSTVGPAVAHGSDAYMVFAGMAMLATIAFSAILTAGLIERFLEPRVLSLFGSRRAPRSGHVVVIGMGQVGLRLCVELRRLGVGVVGLERDSDAPALRVAQALKIPVVFGHGTDRQTLERLGCARARAIATVGSDDLDNIAVAVNASALVPHLPVVIRAGEHEVIARPRSFERLGHLRDVADLASVYVRARLLGHDVDVVATDGETTYLIAGARCVGTVRRDPRLRCGHEGPGAAMPRR
jgi:Trk K+ transport system NAD-binding subunit